ncbi:MAG: hypothetical protein M0Z28_28770 [Rhodospirillales bacterium]|nr:hypothetical protein [Rhodospirillales bacterium]
MHLLRRLAGHWTRVARPRPLPARPELWCRPATLLALRDRRRVGVCVAGWR